MCVPLRIYQIKRVLKARAWFCTSFQNPSSIGFEYGLFPYANKEARKTLFIRTAQLVKVHPYFSDLLLNHLL